MALNELVEKIRAMHPGAYDDMDDATLTKAVLAKYPQYSDLAAPKVQSPVAKGELPDTEPKGQRSVAAAGPSAGAMGMGMVTGLPANPVAGAQAVQSVGHGAALGAAMIAPALTGGASIPIQMGVGAASGAAQTALTGGDEEDIAMSAGIGAAIPGAGAVVKKAASMLPSAKRASEAFQEVMASAKSHPVDISGPGNAALRIQELADRGGSMPMVVRKFLKRITDPAAGPLTYEEARDFYSNATRLSADETKRLTPRLRYEVGNFTKQLGNSVEETAGSVGKRELYQKAMREYGQAKTIEERTAILKKYAIKTGLAAGFGGAGAVGYQMMTK